MSKFLEYFSWPSNLIPSQEDIQSKWGFKLLTLGKKLIKKKKITFEMFNNVYINDYQRDNLLRKYEYQYYKENDIIYAIQISAKDMDDFPNEHFVLSNDKLVSIKETDWLVRSKESDEIYVMQNKTLIHTYKYNSNL